MSCERLESVVNWPGEVRREVARPTSPALMRAEMVLGSCCGVLVLVGGCGVASAGLWSCWKLPLEYWWKR